MSGPMSPLPANLAPWARRIDDAIEAAGYMPDAQQAARISAEIRKLRDAGAISRDDAAALRLAYLPAE